MQRLKALAVERFTEKPTSRAGLRIRSAPDADASYAARIVLNLAEVTPHVSGPDTVQAMQSLAEIETKKVAIQKAYLVSCVNSRLEDLEAAANVLKGKKVAAGVKFYLGAASKWVQEEAEKRGVWKMLMDAGANPLPPGCGPCIGLGVGLLEAGEVGISATNRNFKGRMGSRDAKCYLASPEVVAASAVAGYIRGPHEFAHVAPQRKYTELAAAAGAAEKVEILAGFPQRVKGRLVFMPQDNVNTDAIYGKDYTYRDDMTPEMMAKVVMENYDPQFAARTQAGDVIVSQFNFGTGSSREQAVTCLKAKGIPLVIAASFSQTYLRNAFNNGFLCIEVPEFVARVREQFAKEIAAKEKTIIPRLCHRRIDIDFTSSTISWRGEKFTFPCAGQRAAVAGDRGRSREFSGEAAESNIVFSPPRAPRSAGSSAQNESVVWLSSWSILLRILGVLCVSAVQDFVFIVRSIHGETHSHHHAGRRHWKSGFARIIARS